MYAKRGKSFALRFVRCNPRWTERKICVQLTHFLSLACLKMNAKKVSQSDLDSIVGWDDLLFETCLFENECTFSIQSMSQSDPDFCQRVLCVTVNSRKLV